MAISVVTEPPASIETPDDLIAIARIIGRDIAGPAAADVDRDARFPIEAFEAIRANGLLGALVPTELGGLGAPITTVAGAVEELGRHCASTALIYAMHCIQVACLTRHGHNELLREHLREVARDGLLLASATSEVNIGGDIRSSGCAVERDGDEFRIEKRAPVISYGQHSDAILVTARRSPDSPPGDQVLVYAPIASTSLTVQSGWDPFGFRGTCSNGFVLQTQGHVDEIFPEPFSDIAAATMLPTSHVLWASAWLGLARGAVSTARHYVQAQARKTPGTTPPQALRLAEVMGTLEQLRALVHSAAAEYEAIGDDADAVAGMAYAMRVNGLKVSASELLISCVTRSMEICGMAGYCNDSPHSLGRQMRDAYGSAVMINNERILGANAQMVLVLKERG